MRSALIVASLAALKLVTAQEDCPANEMWKSGCDDSKGEEPSPVICQFSCPEGVTPCDIFGGQPCEDIGGNIADDTVMDATECETLCEESRDIDDADKKKCRFWRWVSQIMIQ